MDLNRAGTPLLEIVTEPDLASADDAVTFARELRNICRFLGVTEGVMQRGHMRFEPNINVIIDDRRRPIEIATPDRRDQEPQLVQGAMHERDRASNTGVRSTSWIEADGLDHGPRACKSTRGWDDERRGDDAAARAKEDAHDYRYFPDPGPGAARH